MRKARLSSLSPRRILDDDAMQAKEAFATKNRRNSIEFQETPGLFI
jgi:hypothetical protein